MALKIYTSSSVSLLSDKLAEQVNTFQEVFNPEFIVTSNFGINNWLKINLASKNGIAANLEFKKHDDIIRIIYGILLNEQRVEVQTSGYVQWAIYNVLGSEDFASKFHKKHTYYKNDNLKRYTLAEKLAGLFQKYQYHIAEELSDVSDWQHYVWQKAMNIAGGFINLNQLALEINNALKDTAKSSVLKNKMPNLHLYLGLDFAKYHLDLYKKLADHININFYAFVPSIGNDEDEVHNVLVENWSKLSNVALGLLDGLGTNQFLTPEPIPNNQLLGKIQNDLLSDSNYSSNINISDCSDQTITINSCYTAAREVEVLYNYLIKTIADSGNTIGAREILVVTSDIEKYAPAVKGVFGSAQKKLPFSIADGVYSSSDSVYSLIQGLLDVSEKFKAEEVVQLLESPFSRDKFQIDNVSKVRQIVEAANIRFGANGDETLETSYVSWHHGLNRMIYGYCMGNEEYYTDPAGKSYLLADLVEGGDALELIRLNTFFNKLEKLVADRQQVKSLSNWCGYLLNVIETFVNDELGEHLGYFSKQLSQLSLFNNVVGEEVEFCVFKEYVSSLISEEANKSNYANKGITICGMSQMRNVPYKVICMLGMDLTSFPRKTTPLSYDLLRSKEFYTTVKDEDKYLFFQTFMAAKEKVYISYIGKSIKDNSNIPPSSVVDELIDYIKEGVGNDSLELVIEHPLHGFSHKYFDGVENEYYSYLYDKTKTRRSIGLSGVNEIIDEIDLNDLIWMFRNPIEYYYRKKLGIYYEEGEESLSDSELFDMDNLQQWILKSKLLVDSSELEVQRLKYVEQGGLPLKTFGEISLEELALEVEGVKQVLERESLGLIPKTYYKKSLIGSDLVYAKIDNVFGNKVIHTTVSKKGSHLRYLTDLYIIWLYLIAIGEDLDCCFNGVGRNFVIWESDEITKEEAKNKLLVLIELYKEGQNRILPFIPELSEALLNKIIKKEVTDEKDVWREIDKKVNPTFSFGFCSEYLKKEHNAGYFDSEDILKELIENTIKILKDLLTKIYR